MADRITEEQLIETQLQQRRDQLAASVNRYMLMVTALLGVSSLLVWIILRVPQMLVVALTMLPIMAMSGLQLLLRRRGQRLVVGVYLMLGSLLLVTLVVPLVMSETQETLANGYILIVVLAHLLLGRQGSLGIITAAALIPAVH